VVFQATRDGLCARLLERGLLVGVRVVRAAAAAAAGGGSRLR